MKTIIQLQMISRQLQRSLSDLQFSGKKRKAQEKCFNKNMIVLNLFAKTRKGKLRTEVSNSEYISQFGNTYKN